MQEDNEVLNKYLNKILNSNAEMRASRDIQQEEEQAMSLVQCQIKTENMPLLSDTHNSHAEPSQPVTQIDLLSLIIK